MSFTVYIGKLAAKAGAQADAVVRKIALDVLTSVIEKSPVDTGRFRGNWQLQIGSVNSSTDSAEDKTGSSAVARASIKLAGAKSGQIIYISNSLPYARRLENGYSNQAPQGMVKLTVINFKRNIRKALR